MSKAPAKNQITGLNPLLRAINAVASALDKLAARLKISKYKGVFIVSLPPIHREVLPCRAVSQSEEQGHEPVIYEPQLLFFGRPWRTLVKQLRTLDKLIFTTPASHGQKINRAVWYLNRGGYESRFCHYLFNIAGNFNHDQGMRR